MSPVGRASNRARRTALRGALENAVIVKCHNCGMPTAVFEDGANAKNMTNLEFMVRLMESGETPLAQAIVVTAVGAFLNTQIKEGVPKRTGPFADFIDPEAWHRDCVAMAAKFKAKYNR